MSISNFQKVVAMNLAFHNPAGDPLVTDWAQLARESRNINSEVIELGDAIDSHNIEDARDALCDIIVFAYGAFHKLGIDADRDMASVINGVMTRFCRDPDELRRTLTYWHDLGVTQVNIEGEHPLVVVKAAVSCTTTAGEDIPAGKFLKSADYQKPVFYRLG